jgi:hypothetical protein
MNTTSTQLPVTPSAAEHDIIALEQLAAALGPLGYQTRLINPAPEIPWLEVSNPQARALSERILVQSSWFWWSWAERLAPVAEAATAAETIARVLRTVDTH